MSTNVTKDGYTMATQVNSKQTPGFAYFNDTIRDGLKGSVFDDADKGYASGKTGMEETLTNCFLGADSWCTSPSQTVNYASCHDNLTLFDHLQTSRPEAGKEDLIKMNNLAAAFYMTAQGVPFLQAGEEMLRTKVNDDGSFNSNSYNAGDKINKLTWADLENEDYAQTFEYYKGLIAFRKAHGALRLTTAGDVASAVTAVNGLDANVMAFDVKGGVNGETAEELFLIFNANEAPATVTLPDGNWNVYINGEQAGTQALATVTDGKAEVAPISAMVLLKEDAPVAAADKASQPSTSVADANTENGGMSTGAVAAIIVVVIAAAAGVAYVIVGRKKA